MMAEEEPAQVREDKTVVRVLYLNGGDVPYFPCMLHVPWGGGGGMCPGYVPAPCPDVPCPSHVPPPTPCPDCAVDCNPVN